MIGVFSFSTLLQLGRDAFYLEGLLKRYSVIFDKIILTGQFPQNPRFSGLRVERTDGTGLSRREQLEYTRNRLIDQVKISIGPRVLSPREFESIFTNPPEFDEMLENALASATNSGIIHSDTILDVMNIMDSFAYSAHDAEQKIREANLALDQINHDYALFHHLSSVLPGYSGITSPKMAKLVSELAGKFVPAETSVIDTVANVNMFDFASLSWREIVELRDSKFAEDFRAKVQTWLQRMHESDCRAAAERALRKELVDSNFKFIRENLPDRQRAWLSGLAGNIPLPTVLNPVSIASAYEDIMKQHHLKTEYGWLYFIAETQAIAFQSRG